MRFYVTLICINLIIVPKREKGPTTITRVNTTDILYIITVSIKVGLNADLLMITLQEARDSFQLQKG